MEWNIEEDEACCRVCVEKYVVEKRHIDIELCLEIIKKNPVISQRDTKSIRMRIQNIKALLNKWKIENTLDISPLNNASSKTRRCLQRILEELGVWQKQT
ncbi:hypothetical protein [Treponema succinifaciens]|uniref:hypothetical protein n=1 Tax=Treponema succinifaciens TaxID=167 RepID=UPI003F7F1899